MDIDYIIQEINDSRRIDEEKIDMIISESKTLKSLFNSFQFESYMSKKHQNYFDMEYTIHHLKEMIDYLYGRYVDYNK